MPARLKLVVRAHPSYHVAHRLRPAAYSNTSRPNPGSAITFPLIQQRPLSHTNHYNATKRKMGEGKKHERSLSSDLFKHPSMKRAKEVDARDNPFKKLAERIEAHTSSSKVKPRNVLHWFRSKDLRAEDNRALYVASQHVREAGSTLLTCFLYSPEDLQCRGTSPARSDFMFERIRLVQEQLEGLNIPLLILTAEERGQKGKMIMNFIKEHDISHVYANYEYEVDKLRRDLDLLDRIEADRNLYFKSHHDQTVVVPGTLLTGSGGPHKVLTPYHKSWLSMVSEDLSLFDTAGVPEANDKAVRKTLQQLFDSQKKSFSSLHMNKLFPSDEDRYRIRGL